MHMALTRDQAQNTSDWGLHIKQDKKKKEAEPKLGPIPSRVINWVIGRWKTDKQGHHVRGHCTPGDLVTSFWKGRENILILHPMSHCGPTQLYGGQSISIWQSWVVNRGLNLEQRCYIKVPKFLFFFPGL